MLANNEVRERIKNAGFAQWRIAEKLGVCEMTIIRWMRTPLSEERKQKILEAVEELSKEVQ